MYKIGIKKYGNNWEVYFSIDWQTFTLKSFIPQTKKEALWYKQQLKTALNRLIKK